MTPQKLKLFRQAMERISAKESLVSMNNIQYPHVSDKFRKKQHRDLYKAAFPENFEEKSVNLSDIRLV